VITQDVTIIVEHMICHQNLLSKNLGVRSRGRVARPPAARSGRGGAWRAAGAAA